MDNKQAGKVLIISSAAVACIAFIITFIGFVTSGQDEALWLFFTVGPITLPAFFTGIYAYFAGRNIRYISVLTILLTLMSATVSPFSLLSPSFIILSIFGSIPIIAVSAYIFVSSAPSAFEKKHWAVFGIVVLVWILILAVVYVPPLLESMSQEKSFKEAQTLSESGSLELALVACNGAKYDDRIQCAKDVLSKIKGTEDPSICNSLAVDDDFNGENAKLISQCILNIAVRGGNIGLCDRLPESYYFNGKIEKGKLYICDLPAREGCMFNVERTQAEAAGKDWNFCFNPKYQEMGWEGQETATFCVSHFLKSPADEAACLSEKLPLDTVIVNGAEVKYASGKDWCYYELAINTGEQQFCSKFNNKRLIDNCAGYFRDNLSATSELESDICGVTASSKYFSLVSR